MLGIKGTGEKRSLTKTEENEAAARRRIIWFWMLGCTILVVIIFFTLGYFKSVYAEYSKVRLQEFVEVWKPIQETNDKTIEADINTLNIETNRIKKDVEGKSAPINARRLKSDVLGFFDYANTFTSDMHVDFQWSKELSAISGEDDSAILAINLTGGTKSLRDAIAVMDNNVTKMDAMVVSPQVADAHKRFRDSVVEESTIYKKLLAAITSNDAESIHVAADDVMVFNEKFDGMSGPSSALTIAYMIKTKEFEIKIDKLKKEIDNSSNIWVNNFYLL